nr:MAG TPA: hypothetical protein [Caudoviricetes sp.]
MLIVLSSCFNLMEPRRRGALRISVLLSASQSPASRSALVGVLCIHLCRCLGCFRLFPCYGYMILLIK